VQRDVVGQRLHFEGAGLLRVAGFQRRGRFGRGGMGAHAS